MNILTLIVVLLVLKANGIIIPLSAWIWIGAIWLISTIATVKKKKEI